MKIMTLNDECAEYFKQCNKIIWVKFSWWWFTYQKDCNIQINKSLTSLFPLYFQNWFNNVNYDFEQYIYKQTNQRKRILRVWFLWWWFTDQTHRNILIEKEHLPLSFPLLFKNRSNHKYN